MAQATHWFETIQGTKLFIPYHWLTKVNLAEMTYVSYQDEDYTDCTFPTVEELIGRGEIKKNVVLPYKQFDINFKSFRSAFQRSVVDRKCDVKVICKKFRKQGFAVTEEAVRHNFWAWMSGAKSGFRDEANGYHLFTPCGLNPLSFRVTGLHPACEDWQTTYIC